MSFTERVKQRVANNEKWGSPINAICAEADDLEIKIRDLSQRLSQLETKGLDE